MSDKEKDMFERFSEAIPKLDREDRNYLLGVAEGMVIAKDKQADEQLQETG